MSSVRQKTSKSSVGQVTPSPVETSAPPRRKPCWVKYPAKSMISLWEAVALTCDIEPDAEIANLIPRVVMREASVPPDLQKYFDRLQGAVAASGNGFPIDGDTDFHLGMTWVGVVALDAFSRWVVEERWPVPERFPISAKSSKPIPPESPKSDRELQTKERTSLLVIVGALCKLAGLDHNDPCTTAARIVNQLAAMGANVGQRTVEEHLKRVEEALDRKG